MASHDWFSLFLEYTVLHFDLFDSNLSKQGLCCVYQYSYAHFTLFCFHPMKQETPHICDTILVITSTILFYVDLHLVYWLNKWHMKLDLI